MRVECPERSASGVEGQTLIVSVLGYSLELRPQNKKSNVLSDLEFAERESSGMAVKIKLNLPFFCGVFLFHKFSTFDKIIL